MKSEENEREAFSKWTNEALETFIAMRFVWLDSFPREERDWFYVRQRIAEEVLAERRGVPLPVKTWTGSVWSKPRAGS